LRIRNTHFQIFLSYLSKPEKFAVTVKCPRVFSVQIRETHTTEVNQGQKSSIPARAANDGYSPFKVDIKQNKVEWALARWVGLPVYSINI
jgi:hypothetical protein